MDRDGGRNGKGKGRQKKRGGEKFILVIEKLYLLKKKLRKLFNNDFFSLLLELLIKDKV